MSICSANLFGPRNQVIKTNGGDIVTAEASTITERLILSDLKIPYKQVLKSRIILKAGQTNYFLNHLGMGSDATFLAIKAKYDEKSVFETSNYVEWSYYNNLSRINYFSYLMILTGNSTHKVPQLYLTNPNLTYSVCLDVMVASIDDEYSIFTDTMDQTGTSFVNLNWTDIHSHVVGESIKINDKSTPVRPLVYFTLTNINYIEIDSTVLTIDDASRGSILLKFKTQDDTYQAHSLFNYVLMNDDINIDNDPTASVADREAPIVYYNDIVVQDWGATYSGPYNSSQGITFSATMSLDTFTSSNIITKQNLITSFIDEIHDNRDGYMSMGTQNIIISASVSKSTITATGSYPITFDFCDIAHNYLGSKINLEVL